jgi:hypothetical protein
MYENSIIKTYFFKDKLNEHYREIPIVSFNGLAIISLLGRVSAGRIRQRKEHSIVSLIHVSNSCHVLYNIFSKRFVIKVDC